jgi:hypothetical protein
VAILRKILAPLGSTTMVLRAFFDVIGSVASCLLRRRHYPGAWFYRWNGLRFTRRNSVMLVSRGLRDVVPVRVNCPREVILCHCSGQEMSPGAERGG